MDDYSDFSNKLNVFSPDGRLLQLENASKSTDQSNLITFAIQNDSLMVYFDLKQVNNSLIRDNPIKKVNSNIFMCASGLRPDAHIIYKHAIYQAELWNYQNKMKIKVEFLAKILSRYFHSFTISDSFRPLGCKIFLYCAEEKRIFILSCDGNSIEVVGGAIGNKENEAISYMENNFDAKEAMKNVAQNDESKILGYKVDLEGIHSIQ